MAAVTLQTLIDRAKAASDVQDEFVSQVEWTTWANTEVLLLENFLLRVGYVLRENTVSITATGATSYSLTQDPMAVLAVYEVKDSRWRRLRPGDLVDGPGGIDTVTTGAAQQYRFIQDATGVLQLLLWPNAASGSYKVRVVTAPTALASLSSSVNYPAGFEERIVLGMARRALAKEETVNTVLEQHLREIEQHIEEVAVNRVFSAHQAIRNTDHIERAWGWSSSMPGMPYPAHWYIF